MGNVGFSLSNQGAQEFKQLSRQLRKAGRTDLRKKLREKIKAAGDPVLNDVRQAARSVHVTAVQGGKGSSPLRPSRTKVFKKKGLRDRVARATSLSITANGVKFRVNGSRVDEKYPNMPKYLDATGKFALWRHPVFGDKNAWAEQRGQPWFAETIKKSAPKFRQAVLEAMNEIAHELEQ